MPPEGPLIGLCDIPSPVGVAVDSGMCLISSVASGRANCLTLMRGLCAQLLNQPFLPARFVPRCKGSLDLVEPRQKQPGDRLRLLDQRPAGEDQRRQFCRVAIDLDVISDPFRIADEIDCRRTGVENIEWRPGRYACEESPLEPQLFKLWQTTIEQRLDSSPGAARPAP